MLAAAVLAALTASAGAQQQQFAELHKRYLPDHVDPTRALALGDVDGDGDLDLVVGNFDLPAIPADHPTRLYLNHGDGTYDDATAQLPPGAHKTTAAVLGDVDGDGDLDLVIGNEWEQNRLYLNNGAATFVDATAARLPSNSGRTQALVLGDVDGDGDLDLIVGNYAGQDWLYLNNGAGTFTDVTAQRLPIDTDRTTALALGDVDGDGDLDLVTGARFSSPRGVYLNNGNGTFVAAGTHMPWLVLPTSSLALGDVDGDGDLDVVFGCGANFGNPNVLLLNTGAGWFVDGTAGRLPADSDFTMAVALGDLDGDGDLDLVVGNGGSPGHQNRLYLNDGTGVFADATAVALPHEIDGTTTVALGDVDGDGDLDLVAGNGGYGYQQRIAQQNRLYLNNGGGNFAGASARRLPLDIDQTGALALGDFDGDGYPDIVVGNRGDSGNFQGEQNRFWRNDGSAAFSDETELCMPVDVDHTTALAAGDLDGDGDVDLVVGNGAINGEQNRLYLNTGSGILVDRTASRIPAVLDYTSSLLLGDVDGDGDLDLVVGNGRYFYGQQNRLYLNNGTGTFVDVTAVAMPLDLDATHALALADVDGDGDLDLILGNTRQNRLYLNDGTGIFTDATAARLPAFLDITSSLAVGDVDGDGDLDLVVGNGSYRQEQNRLYVNNGAGFFTDATAGRLPVGSDGTRAVALGDVDEDGDLDLFAGNWSAPDRLYVNNGAGVFTDATTTRLANDSDYTTALLFADVDRDGDLDVLAGNYSGRQRLHLNLLRQLDAPQLLRSGHTYRLDAYARYGPYWPYDLALPYFSFAPANIALPPFGTLGIDPAMMIALPLIVIPPFPGAGSLSLPIPMLPALDGMTIHTQALLLLPTGRANLTNVVREVFLR